MKDGTPIFVDTAISATDRGLVAALSEVSLPTGDLGDPGRHFFAYEMSPGERVGYGGFELYGNHLLLRSIVALTAFRRSGAGAGILALLLRRGFDSGARQAWLLTTTAGEFFIKAGFTPIDRSLAPGIILSTRQASSLCPASASLMTRSIRI